jgi:hypothetical protein
VYSACTQRVSRKCPTFSSRENAIANADSAGRRTLAIFMRRCASVLAAMCARARVCARARTREPPCIARRRRRQWRRWRRRVARFCVFHREKINRADGACKASAHLVTESDISVGSGALEVSGAAPGMPS